MGTILLDESPFPFGKHKGKMMMHVPVSYLHWLWTNGKQHEVTCPVHDYIVENMDALKEENKDLIWDEL